MNGVYVTVQCAQEQAFSVSAILLFTAIVRMLSSKFIALLYRFFGKHNDNSFACLCQWRTHGMWGVATQPPLSSISVCFIATKILITFNHGDVCRDCVKFMSYHVGSRLRGSTHLTHRTWDTILLLPFHARKGVNEIKKCMDVWNPFHRVWQCEAL